MEYFDGCDDPTLYYSRLGIAVLEGCCGIKGHRISCGGNCTNTTNTHQSVVNHFHFLKPYRTLTTKQTLVFAFVAMGGVGAVALYLYLLNPSFASCHNVPYTVMQQEEEDGV
jgi:hypothetical protein